MPLMSGAPFPWDLLMSGRPRPLPDGRCAEMECTRQRCKRPTGERRAIKAHFHVMLIMQIEVHIYFDPATRRIHARSTGRAPEAARAPARGAPAIPPRAHYVGTYGGGASFEDFESDLIDVLDRHRLERLK